MNVKFQVAIFKIREEQYAFLPNHLWLISILTPKPNLHMKNLLLVGAICLPLFSFSQDFESTEADSLVYDQFYSDSIYASFEDSVNNALHYEHGTIDLGDGIATLQVPAGFKYLNPDQSLYVLSTL